MLLAPSHTSHQSRRSDPGLSPALARRRHREALKTEVSGVSSIAQSQCVSVLGKLILPSPATNELPLQQIATGSGVNYTARQRKAISPCVGWDQDEREDRHRPAPDHTVIVPSEKRRLTPSLRRQEAFHWHDDIATDAELYRLGILYDGENNNDEHVREPQFCLNAMVHADPIESFRRAKRVKRTHPHESPSNEDNLSLSVELVPTFTENDAVTSLFFATVNNEQLAGLREDNINEMASRRACRTTRKRPAEPLAIIHETEETLAYTLGSVPEASDIPDLVSDTENEASQTRGDRELTQEPDSDISLLNVSADAVDLVPDAIREMVGEFVDGWVFLSEDNSKQAPR